MPFARADAAGIDLQIFVGIGNVALPRGDPVADHTRADHIGDEFVFAAIPGKQNRAGAASAVELRKGMRFLGSEIYFVLRDAGGPQESDDLDIFLRAESSEYGGGVLAEIPGSAGHFPLLIERAGINFDFGSDSSFVVAEGFQVDMHPVVLSGPFAAKNYGWPAS